jgi:hypothetical protein
MIWISKIKVESGGIFSPNPSLPYANSDGIVISAFWSFFKYYTDSSHPIITYPSPTLNWNGSSDLSNIVPSYNFPTYYTFISSPF